jgi:hypothetical protein
MRFRPSCGAHQSSPWAGSLRPCRMAGPQRGIKIVINFLKFYGNFMEFFTVKIDF